MTDRVLRPDGTGFHLAGGELTVTGPAEQAITAGQPVNVSVTAGLFGAAGMDVMLASWNTAHTELSDARSGDGRTFLRLRTQPVMLNSLPSSVRVQLRAAVDLHDSEGAWQLALHFRNHAGSSLTWNADLPAEAFDAGWMAPLADLLTIDAAAVEPGVVEPAHVPSQSPTAVGAVTSTLAPPAVAVVHHSADEYYELVVDGERAGILVYHTIGSQLSITHTVIEQTYRGRGLSWALVGQALDDIRTKFVTVSNYCAVVSRFVEKHPEYRDLLNPPRPA